MNNSNLPALSDGSLSDYLNEIKKLYKIENPCQNKKKNIKSKKKIKQTKMN